MRILYLNPNGSMGGAERALIDLIAAVRQARPDWKLDLIAGGDGDFADAARTLGMNVHVLAFPQSFNRLGDAGAGGPAGNGVSRAQVAARLSLSVPQLAAYAWKLRRLISAHQPDLIHSNGFKTHILAAWAVPRRCKLIWHVHDYVGSRPLMSRLMRMHAKRCDMALANSNSVACDLETVCGDRLKVQTVYNAVDLERFNPEGPRLDLDALSGLAPAPAGTLRVGLVATMARWKGHEVFLRALAMLPNGREIRGYVIGGPIYDTEGSQYTLDELRELARELRIGQRVGFTGYVNDSAGAMRALDVVVHASTQPEPFGLVVAEAMACGRPVVVSFAGGVSEIVATGQIALAHTPGDASAMAASLLKLALDADLRRLLGREGRCRAARCFGRHRLGREILRAYESTVVWRN